MSKFSFTSPDGQLFEILGPAGATVEQARAIFEQQVRSGGLAGLRAGDVVSAVTQAEAGLRSALSQLGVKIPSATEQAFASLRNISVTNPISVSDFIKQATPNFSLGPLNSSDLQGLMSQTATQVGQKITDFTAQAGIGKFGLDINKLEQSGYVKPGTAQAFAKSLIPESADKLQSFLSPASFTGKDGISSLQGILTNDNIQNKVQETVLKQSYNLLASTGITKGLSPTQLGGLLQTASTFDVKTAVNFAKGLDVKNLPDVLSVAKAGEYATSLVNRVGGLGPIGDLPKLAASLGNLNSIQDLAGLSKQLGNLDGIAGQLGNLSGIAGQLGLGGVSGALGGLGGIAGQIGGLSGITGQLGSLSGIAGQLGGQLANLDISQLSSLSGIAGALGNLGGIAGKLGSLSGIAGQLGGLGGIAGQLGNLSGIAGQLGNLSGIAGQLGSLSSATSIAGAAATVVGIVAGLFGGRGGSIYAGTKRPQGSLNTVNRSTVDASIDAIIGNAKIATPSFSPQSSNILSGLRSLKALSGLANMSIKLST